tara:strand:- start:506 stop:1660 length:1155 start_codon:yes stop_codon:yes gene_type:complete
MVLTVLSLLLLATGPTTALAATPAELIATIRAVNKKGQGSPEAGKAVAELSAVGPESLLAVLRAFDGANPLATNYLRSVAETIVDRALAAKAPLPQKSLEAFIGSLDNDPHARRLAFEIVVRVDGSVTDRLIPGMLTDPNPVFRRQAVARLLDLAGRLNKERQPRLAADLYRQALRGATDDDQVQAIAKPLRSLGEKVDLPRHFGFLTQWNIVGPFDNTGGKGFAAVYAPESKLDLKATLKGKLGPATWKSYSTSHDFGILDIAKQIKPYKGAVMYCTTTFVSGSAQAIQFRLGTPNAWKLWVNGKQMFANEEYHRGMKIDQYSVPVTLRAGANTILLKICQNEQTQDWAQRYQFQIRTCNKSGIAVLAADASARRTTARETQP